jgi:3-hydroxyisobutyrate dehydrogenase-like beta-hydroxyacid dehydrogenase
LARALIVGCGCRGVELAKALGREGWLVRGTSRDPERIAEIEAAGAEAALADPDRVETILDHIGDVAVIYWLLGSATGDPQTVAALHAERLESLLGRIVDTPVRSFVYEAAGSVDPAVLHRGAEIVRGAGERWRIPVAVVEEEPRERRRWLQAMHAAPRYE